MNIQPKNTCFGVPRIPCFISGYLGGINQERKREGLRTPRQVSETEGRWVTREAPLSSIWARAFALSPLVVLRRWTICSGRLCGCLRFSPLQELQLVISCLLLESSSVGLEKDLEMTNDFSLQMWKFRLRKVKWFGRSYLSQVCIGLNGGGTQTRSLLCYGQVSIGT